MNVCILYMLYVDRPDVSEGTDINKTDVNNVNIIIYKIG